MAAGQSYFVVLGKYVGRESPPGSIGGLDSRIIWIHSWWIDNIAIERGQLAAIQRQQRRSIFWQRGGG